MFGAACDDVRPSLFRLVGCGGRIGFVYWLEWEIGRMGSSQIFGGLFVGFLFLGKRRGGKGDGVMCLGEEKD